MTKALTPCRCCGILMDQPDRPETHCAEDGMCLTCVIYDDKMNARRAKLADQIMCYGLLIVVVVAFLIFS